MKHKERELVRVYSSRAKLRDPKKFFTDMFHDIRSCQGLALRLTMRNISAMYRQTFLGYAWIILSPLMTSFVFVLLNQFNIISTGLSGTSYVVFSVLGTTLWQTFTEAINAPLRVMSLSSGMLTKHNFARETMIFSAFYQGLIMAAAKLALSFVVMLVLGVPLSFTFLLGIIGTVLLSIFGLTLGVLLLPLAMLVKDVERGLGIILSFMFYLTDAALVLSSGEGLIGKLGRLNPVNPLLNTARQWLMNGTFIDGEIISGFVLPVTSFWLVLAATVFIGFVGLIIFRISVPHLVSRLSA